jgi:hypothetical protein
VNPGLIEQVNRLNSLEVAELRDVIVAKPDADVPAGQWAILERRVAEANANLGDYITVDEWKAGRVA